MPYGALCDYNSLNHYYQGYMRVAYNYNDGTWRFALAGSSDA